MKDGTVKAGAVNAGTVKDGTVKAGAVKDGTGERGIEKWMLRGAKYGCWRGLEADACLKMERSSRNALTFSTTFSPLIKGSCKSIEKLTYQITAHGS